MKLRHHLKKHFVPHEGNNYRPHFLRMESAVIILALIVFIELGTLAQPLLMSFNKDYYMAAVLPGVLVALTNQERADNNAGELKVNALLTEAANLKAQDMASKGYFSHTTPEGYNSWYWLDKVGYLYSYAGENLAVNFFESEDVAKAWMNSPTHRDNIVNRNYQEIGIGMADGIYQGKQTVFVAQFFGTPKFGLVNKLAEATENPVRDISEAIAPSTTPKVVKPLSTIAVSTSTIATTTASTTVLGAETNSPVLKMPAQKELASISFFKAASASPRSNAFYLLTILSLAIFASMLFIYFSRGKILHYDLILTGLLLIVIISGVLAFNAGSFARTVELPADNSGSATTSLAGN